MDFYWVKRGVMMRGDKDPALLGCRCKHQQLVHEWGRRGKNLLVFLTTPGVSVV